MHLHSTLFVPDIGPFERFLTIAQPFFSTHSTILNFYKTATFLTHTVYMQRNPSYMYMWFTAVIAFTFDVYMCVITHYSLPPGL